MHKQYVALFIFLHESCICSVTVLEGGRWGGGAFLHLLIFFSLYRKKDIADRPAELGGRGLLT